MDEKIVSLEEFKKKRDRLIAAGLYERKMPRRMAWLESPRSSPNNNSYIDDWFDPNDVDDEDIEF